MTQPVQEPSLARSVAAADYRVRQLARRPAPVSDEFLVANLHIKLFADDEVVVTGDGRFFEAIAENMDQFILSNVEIFVSTVSSSGIVQVQIHNRTTASDMLSTRIQIDANEKNSADASTTYVIDPAEQLVAWEDEIRIDVDQAGTGAKGLGIHLEFVEGTAGT